MATQQINPVSTPQAVPICNALRRPSGRSPIHIPSTKMLIGSVASPLSGASMVPTIAAVATSTVLLPPASACAIASTSALRRARRSPARACATGSATADIYVLRNRMSVEQFFFLAGGLRINQYSVRRSEVHRARMADRRRARLRWTQRAHLAECRLHLVDHEIDHVAGTFSAERAQAPQEGFT